MPWRCPSVHPGGIKHRETQTAEICGYLAQVHQSRVRNLYQAQDPLPTPSPEGETIRHRRIPNAPRHTPTSLTSHASHTMLGHSNQVISEKKNLSKMLLGPTSALSICGDLWSSVQEAQASLCSMASESSIPTSQIQGHRCHLQQYPHPVFSAAPGPSICCSCVFSADSPTRLLSIGNGDVLTRRYANVRPHSSTRESTLRGTINAKHPADLAKNTLETTSKY